MGFIAHFAGAFVAPISPISIELVVRRSGLQDRFAGAEIATVLLVQSISRSPKKLVVYMGEETGREGNARLVAARWLTCGTLYSGRCSSMETTSCKTRGCAVELRLSSCRSGLQDRFTRLSGEALRWGPRSTGIGRTRDN